ncbi:MAG: polysaccharide pyruvyl transferase family protein [Candidatus Peribacteria bacterium]|nr:MAG: polysaccharide pyruvyl transferase family protein [Candidatus Peribacteria bacterium]
MQYPGIILGTQRFMILGGVTFDPEHPGRHIRTLLRHARAVILRDETSYEYAKAISPDNVTLYHDRAYDALDQLDLPKKAQTSDYVLLNIHPHVLESQSELIDRLDVWMTAHGAQKIYFVPGDLRQDQVAFDQLKVQYPQLERRDRSTHSLPEILDFFAGADEVAASRLHVLLLAQETGHRPTVFSYHPKIQKVL